MDCRFNYSKSLSNSERVNPVSESNFKQKHHLLNALPENEYQRLAPYLQSVALSLGAVLYEADELIETVYLPISGLISIVDTLENGMTTEIGLIGNNDIVGLPIILGCERSPNRIIVQIAGSALKLSRSILKQEFERGEVLQKILLSYSLGRLIQISQLAVCNRHHSIEERLARWLLTVADEISSHHLPLTQQFIATMLGVRRSSVTITAGMLQNLGIIRYSRGHITIVDRPALENASCECYHFLKQKLQQYSIFS